MDLFTIINGSVSGVDTIFSRSQGLCYSPAFNLSGTSIAFYRLSSAPGAGTSCATANSGKTTISVMDISSRNVINLCELSEEPLMKSDGAGGLDWPAGDWIYYLKTTGPTNTEVWKVNASSKETMNVGSFALNGQPASDAYFRRFSLDLEANRMGYQILPNSGIGFFTSDVGSFPNGCTITGFTGGCNSAISASGNYQAKFMGYHSQLILSLYPGTTGIMQPSHGIDDYNLVSVFQQSTIDQFGADADGLNWAVNSDKWVLQQTGWYGYGGQLSYGTEQVACNWVDKVAIRISNNGKKARETCPAEGRPGPDCCAGCGTIYAGNCPGDLWVDGGAENLNKFEDASGVWHEVPGAIPALATTPMPNRAIRQLTISADTDGMLTINLSSPHGALVRISDLCGRTFYSTIAAGRRCKPERAFISGVYCIYETGKDFAHDAKVTVSQ